MLRKIISLFLSFGLLFQQLDFAQVAGELNIAGHLANMHSNITIYKFRPLHLRYFSYDLKGDNFKFLFDKGDSDRDGSLMDGSKREPSLSLKEQTQALLNYFLIGITLPDSKFWVNLRPDSEDQLIEPELAQTDLGRVLLEADLQLKKDTARYTSPETPEGREYWNKLYKKAEELFGHQAITIPTLTRPWIVPGEIIIRETSDSSFIYKSTLKVMLEEDYLEKSQITNYKSQITNYKQYDFKDPRLKTLNEYSSQLIRELIIPKLTKEVNISKKYAPLRQVFYSLILSRWFKARFKGAIQGLSPQTGTGHFPSELTQSSAKESVPSIKGTVPFYVGLIDSNNLNGLTSKESWSKTTYFKEYQKSFNNGEYNLKEPVHTPTGQVIRSYFSGGNDFTGKTLEARNLLGYEGGLNPGVYEGNPNFVLQEGIDQVSRQAATEDVTAGSPIMKRRTFLKTLPFVPGALLSNKEEAEALPATTQVILSSDLGKPFTLNPYRIRITGIAEGLLARDRYIIIELTFPDGFIKEMWLSYNQFEKVGKLKELKISIFLNDILKIEIPSSGTIYITRDGFTLHFSPDESRKFERIAKQLKDKILYIGGLNKKGENRPFAYGLLQVLDFLKRTSTTPYFGPSRLFGLPGSSPDGSYYAYDKRDPNNYFTIAKYWDYRKEIQLTQGLGLTVSVDKGRLQFGVAFKKGEQYIDIRDITKELDRSKIVDFDAASSPVSQTKTLLDSPNDIFDEPFTGTVSLNLFERIEFGGYRRPEVHQQQGSLSVEGNTVTLQVDGHEPESWSVGITHQPAALRPRELTILREGHKPGAYRLQITQKDVVRVRGRVPDLEITWQILAESGAASSPLSNLEAARRILLNRKLLTALYGINDEYSMWLGTGDWSQRFYKTTLDSLALRLNEHLQVIRPGLEEVFDGKRLPVDVEKYLTALERAVAEIMEVLSNYNDAGLALKKIDAMVQARDRLYDILDKITIDAQDNKRASLPVEALFRVLVVGVDFGELMYYEQAKWETQLRVSVTVIYDLADALRYFEKHRNELDGVYIGGNPNTAFLLPAEIKRGIEQLQRDHLDKGLIVINEDESHTATRVLYDAVRTFNSVRERAERAARNIVTELKNRVVSLQMTAPWQYVARVHADQLPWRGVIDYLSQDKMQAVGLDFSNVEHRKLVAVAIKRIIAEKTPTEDGRTTSISPAQTTTEASSPLLKPGGIDFRVMNIVTQPLVSSSSLNLKLPQLANLADFNLDEEFKQLKNMLAAGIIPSGERIKEYLAACQYKGEWNNRIPDIISCLIEVCRLEEDNVCETPLEIKEALIIADSGNIGS